MIWNNEKPIRVDIKFIDSPCYIIADDLDIERIDDTNSIAKITVSKDMYNKSQLKYIIEKHQGFIANYIYPSTTISIPMSTKSLKLNNIQNLDNENSNKSNNQLLLSIDCIKQILPEISDGEELEGDTPELLTGFDLYTLSDKSSEK